MFEATRNLIREVERKFLFSRSYFFHDQDFIKQISQGIRDVNASSDAIELFPLETTASKKRQELHFNFAGFQLHDEEIVCKGLE